MLVSNHTRTNFLSLDAHRTTACPSEEHHARHQQERPPPAEPAVGSRSPHDTASPGDASGERRVDHPGASRHGRHAGRLAGLHPRHRDLAVRQPRFPGDALHLRDVRLRADHVVPDVLVADVSGRPPGSALSDPSSPAGSAGAHRRRVRHLAADDDRPDPVLPRRGRDRPQDDAVGGPAGVPVPAGRPAARRPAGTAREAAHPVAGRGACARRRHHRLAGRTPRAVRATRSKRYETLDDRRPGYGRRGLRPRGRVPLGRAVAAWTHRRGEDRGPRRRVLRRAGAGRARQGLRRRRLRPARRPGRGRAAAAQAHAAALPPAGLDVPGRADLVRAQALRLALARGEQGHEPQQLHRSDGPQLRAELARRTDSSWPRPARADRS